MFFKTRYGNKKKFKKNNKGRQPKPENVMTINDRKSGTFY